MINCKKILAIIPARGGSKGLPGKNIKELCGKPLIVWTIEAGLTSRYIDEVIVSTDSPEIARIARDYGASVPFIRPDHLSGDEVSSFDVLNHAIFFCKGVDKEFDYVVMLEPTSPLRHKDDIDMAIEQLLANPPALAMVGICKTESQNPAFLVRKGDANFLIGYENKEMPVMRRQEINDVYFFEGSIYVSDMATLLSRKTFYHESTLGYEVPKWKSLEIDDIEDFVMVEALMKFKGIVK